ncbi:MAG: hypothetical protein ACYC1Y_03270 [Minisyncoccota bacterium]
MDWFGSNSVNAWVPTSGYVPSGTQENPTHTWGAPGTYTVRALTQNSSGAQSGWSSACNVVVNPVPVNGACIFTHYSCAAGTSILNVSGASSWTWSCQGSGGGSTASCSETKTAPTVTLTPTTITIPQGSTVPLTWTSSSPLITSCTSSGFPTHGATSGTATVQPLTTTPYQVQCTAPGFPPIYSPFATVTVLTPTASISATPNRVQSGGSTTVSWQATNVKTCDIKRNGITSFGSPLAADTSGTVANSGTLDPTPITVQTTYVMTCKNAAAQVVAQAQTTVNVAPSYREF